MEIFGAPRWTCIILNPCYTRPCYSWVPVYVKKKWKSNVSLSFIYLYAKTNLKCTRKLMQNVKILYISMYINNNVLLTYYIIECTNIVCKLFRAKPVTTM